jgi:hypothetical protein
MLLQLGRVDIIGEKSSAARFRPAPKAGNACRSAAFFLLAVATKEEALTQMKSSRILAATALALIADASVANAQTTVITREPVETRTVVTAAPVQLTPAQRQTVYRTIVRERVAPARATVEYRVGTRIPQSAQLYTLPHDVAVEVPALQPYKYMVVNGRVLLVDPNTSQVVAELAE